MEAFIGKREKNALTSYGAWWSWNAWKEKYAACTIAPRTQTILPWGRRSMGQTAQKSVYTANYKSEGSFGKQISLCDIRSLTGNVTNGTTLFQRMMFLLVATALCAHPFPSSLIYTASFSRWRLSFCVCIETCTVKTEPLRGFLCPAEIQ